MAARKKRPTKKKVAKKRAAKKAPAKKPTGRPSKFAPEMCEQAYKLCLLGATNERLADFFQVGLSTLERWLQEKPAFRGSVKAGREEADARVGQALFERATGYSHPELKVFQHNGMVVTHEVVKHYPPDPASMIFWLKNRRPDLWRDKVQTELTGKDGGPVETKTEHTISKEMTPEQAAAVYREALQGGGG